MAPWGRDHSEVRAALKHESPIDAAEADGVGDAEEGLILEQAEEPDRAHSLVRESIQ